MNDRITKEDFGQWLNNTCTKAVLDKLHEYRDNYVSALANGETVFHQTGKTQAETARAIGVIYGLDLILEMKYEDEDEQ